MGDVGDYARMEEGELAGGRYDLCIVFPYKTDSNVKYGDSAEPNMRVPNDKEQMQMANWEKRRNMVLKSLVNAGLSIRCFYSRDKDEVFCKIGTNVGKLKEIAESTKHKIRMKDEYDGAYAPYVRDFPGTPEFQYMDRRKVSHVYAPAESADADDLGSASVFSTRDRIILLNHCVMSRQQGSAGIDVAGLKRSGNILAYFPLHETRLRDKLDEKSFDAFVWGSKLGHVRDYFGEKVALYFGWSSYLTFWLFLACFPAAVDLVFDILFMSPDNITTPLFAIFMALWASLFTHFWTRKEAELSVEWGTFDNEPEYESPRPEFKGDVRYNPVTRKPDLHYPFMKRLPFIILSSIVIAIVTVIAIGAMLAVYFTRHLFAGESMVERWGFMFALCAAVHLFDVMFTWLAAKLTDMENYRTNTEYESALMTKSLVFKFINAYGALFYIAFFKEHQMLLGVEMQCINDDCLLDLSYQLTAFIIYRLFIQNLIEWAWPKIAMQLRMTTEYLKSGAGSDGNLLQDAAQAERQAKMDTATTFADFDENWIQFGYVALFSISVPWLPIVALIANIVEVILDKGKLLYSVQRPFPEAVRDIGGWNPAFELLGFIAMLVNIALAVFDTDVFGGLEGMSKLTWFFVLEHGVLVVRLLAWFILPSPAPHIRNLMLKHRHTVHENVHCVTDDDDEMRSAALQSLDYQPVIYDNDEDDD
uniref:Anoctamin dimerisation domain-containing protein n=1 Tax=Chromera velia CCMP2878 TaxID=1169474 RepID=A0A0G4HKY0_9ALVE|eukprot:Cvel_7289.t1-p1 / transcript=Cvel_7289.t1 / gene=Cvel_7289 / organism=Chromera_velia_CCMP2878 / gene_product=Anoctamin-10, putative / transcript_product=Anoctamin-10, putative / location=Cvel_scaffold377:3931-13405(+) / protein_length=701 / sequence_SO=supercontig / SO=protein_coding / is_pseudo=false